MTNFMQIFTNEKAAINFASEHYGKVIVRYNYDGFYQKIITEYVVYFN